MTIRIRTRLFSLSVLSILAALGVVGIYLSAELRTWLEDHTANQLLRLARTSHQVLTRAEGANNIATMDPLADELGQAGGARVTIIAADGRVLGDSALSADAVAEMENHADRPEVVQAFAEGSGHARRYSATLTTGMLYQAVAYERQGSRGVVRIAMSLEDVDHTVANLHLLLAIAGLIALGVTVFISAVASHIVTRALRGLVSKAQTAAASGERAGRRDEEPGDQGTSFGQLAEDLERTVSTLASERARFETVLSAMAEAVLVLDTDQRLTLFNPAARDLLDLPADAQGKELIDTIRVPQLLDLVEDGLAGRALTAELELPGPSPRYLMALGSPLGSDRGVVVVLHDLTELRRLERVRRDFVANVSHELRTPVSIMRANAETLLDGAIDDPERAHTFLEAVLRNAERLSSLLADLLDIARIESGQFDLELADLELAAAVERAAETVRPMAFDQRQELVVEVPADLRVRADEKALDQVLLNLLDNAVKYTPEDGRIAVSARGLEGGARLEIRDDGPGIEPQHRDRIFERFYRVDKGRSREKGGTGLGLSIVKNLVDAMGGEVGVDANQPNGSVFWLKLTGPKT